MSRFIEIERRVSAHQFAPIKRRVGLPIWERGINIKAILRLDPHNVSARHSVSVAGQIAALLRQRVPAEWLDVTSAAYDGTLNDVIDGLSSLSVTDNNPHEVLDGWLADLDAWARATRVLLC